MNVYLNRGGDSGVRGYEVGDDYIKVGFYDGSLYEYTYASAGSGNVEYMKRLAIEGEGLNAFINATVKYGYSRKLH